MVSDIWSEQIELFIILDYFLPFNSPSNRENQKFEKMKNIPGDIIILHVYHKCKSYDVWSTKDRILSHLDHFLSFYLPNNPENQNFEKKIKKCLDISSFYTSVP